MVNEIHNPQKLLESLCSLPRETTWIEFKENKFDHKSIGQYISSLANSAMLDEKDSAYLIFGVRDHDHAIVGTTVDLLGETIGSESLIFWLNKLIEPHITINPITFEYNGKHIEILCIDPGYIQPVKFQRISYIRIDSMQQPLTNYPERERTLWQITSRYSFESCSLKPHLTDTEILNGFEVQELLKLIGVRGNSTPSIEYLEQSGLVRDDLQGKYEVSSLLGIVSSKDLNNISLLENKGTRVIVYKGRDKLDALDDVEGKKGYLVSFTALLQFIMRQIPSKESLIHGARTKTHDIPEASIREFLANALIHQDFTQTGSRPTVEIFKDKIKITNPGTPLISVDRFIDTPSKTRNPKFAKLMRDAGFCEERGSGVDRAIREIERSVLPPPLIETVEGSTVVTVFMPRKFASMTAEERVRACFQHACLCYESGTPMNNASLRERFGLSQKQYPQVSNVIRDAIDAGKIRPQSEEQANRNARYVPFYVM